eukprot:TRINITY_DN6634_c0_g1_i1.p1 TRINITY_DN6634_c0_g1~~TRINITY_DN6634_c0_g1_i1.p1  ORF type:complete len:211 (+),score=14.51 TRINITY_DN6634_c0_g1_i1:62-694(+)
MKISTPNTPHLAQPEFQDVYEPAEDSYLLLDALEQDLDTQSPLLVVEIGSGSGIISSALSSCYPEAIVLATDVNTSACQATLNTASLNQNKNIQVVRTDFLQCLWDRVKGKVDLLVCNPPYVATDEVELGSKGIEASWAGGHLGLDLTRRIVENLNEILSPNGISYLVLEQCNKPDEFIEEIRTEHGLTCEKVLSRRAGREFLTVIKIKR